MIVGIPAELKQDEYRVAIVPAGVAALKKERHTVLVQSGAGKGSDISDQMYAQAGAKIIKSASEVYKKAELILKVKEPLPKEYPLLRPNQTLFTFFHFAADRKLTQAMQKTKVTCIAYETLEDEHGHLPILVPMSEVAGRMSVQEGAKYLERPFEGKGILLGGIPGVSPARVLVLGGGVVGANAAKVAAGVGAEVTVMDVELERLRYLEDISPDNISFLMSNEHNVEERIVHADLVICAALKRGGRSPILINKKLLKKMKPGSVIVDVAIDQGGCCETSRPTTHQAPTYVVEKIVHYCVTNIPGAVPNTSTYGLTNATLPFVLELANRGVSEAIKHHPLLERALNIVGGKIVYQPIAQAHGLTYTPLKKVMS